MSHEESLSRLRTARGHLDAVIRMVEDGRYCIDVLHQIRAVQGALDRSRRTVLDNHLRTCVRDGYAAGDIDRIVDELLDATLGGGAPRAGRDHHCSLDATPEDTLSPRTLHRDRTGAP